MQPRILTLQPHQLIVAFLAQLQFPAVLAQQLLIVAVDLLNGLADLGSMHTTIKGLALLASLPWSSAQAEYPTCTVAADQPLRRHSQHPILETRKTEL